MINRLAAVTVAMALAGAVAAARAQPDAVGVRGSVGNHEGTPVAEGTVSLQSSDRSSIVTASLDRSGRFHVVPSVAGRHRLTILAPGYASRMVDVIVPGSRMMALPTLLLEAPAYFRARFVNADGDVIVYPVIRRRSLGVEGVSFPGTGADTSSRVDADGSVTIGPLPSGVTTMALDMPGLAHTRLPDITVRGDQVQHDGGTIVIQPGTVLRVDIVNSDGAPVANHPVSLQDVRPNSPLEVRTVRTDHVGRATFDRIGAGRYLVGAPMIELCNGRAPLSTGQLVEVNGTGAAGVRMAVGGRAALRVTSQGAPLTGRAVFVAPDGDARPASLRTITMPGRPPIVLAPPSCPGSTDGDGRATFTHVPQGAARVSVRLHNSTFERQVKLPADARDITIEVPNGLIQLRVINATTGRGVPQASVTWSGGGYRVLATATGSGDVLLEGVGDSPGLISATASGFLESKVEASASPATFEMALTPEPSRERTVRIVADTGEPIANAIVLLAPATVFNVGVYAATNTDGVVRFIDVPPGVARVVVHADGFVGAALNLRSDSDAPATLALSRVKH
jgi:hypothetical protein